MFACCKPFHQGLSRAGEGCSATRGLPGAPSWQPWTCPRRKTATRAAAARSAAPTATAAQRAPAHLPLQAAEPSPYERQGQSMQPASDKLSTHSVCACDLHLLPSAHRLSHWRWRPGQCRFGRSHHARLRPAPSPWPGSGRPPLQRPSGRCAPQPAVPAEPQAWRAGPWPYAAGAWRQRPATPLATLAAAFAVCRRCTALHSLPDVCARAWYSCSRVNRHALHNEQTVPALSLKRPTCSNCGAYGRAVSAGSPHSRLQALLLSGRLSPQPTQLVHLLSVPPVSDRGQWLTRLVTQSPGMPLGKRTDCGDSKYAGVEVPFACDIVEALEVPAALHIAAVPTSA